MFYVKNTTVVTKSNDLEYRWQSRGSKNLNNSISHMIGICVVQVNGFLFVFPLELNI